MAWKAAAASALGNNGSSSSSGGAAEGESVLGKRKGDDSIDIDDI